MENELLDKEFFELLERGVNVFSRAGEAYRSLSKIKEKIAIFLFFNGGIGK